MQKTENLHIIFASEMYRKGFILEEPEQLSLYLIEFKRGQRSQN